MDARLAIFVGVTLISSVTGNPYERPVEVSPDQPEDHCTTVTERNVCIPIIVEAFNNSGNGLEDAFNHYCSFYELLKFRAQLSIEEVNNPGAWLRNHLKLHSLAIPAFVPCLEENRSDALELMECSRQTPEMAVEKVLGDRLNIEEQLDMSLDFINAVNNILCDRTDEAADLIECVKRKDRQFQPILRRCIANHAMPVMMLMSHGMDHDMMPDTSTMCMVMYGFTSCLKDGMVEMCGDDYFDLLETTYEEVIVEVVGNAIGCNVKHEPLLDFVRSLQEKFRR